MVAAIATMVVIKAAGDIEPAGLGVLTPRRNRRIVGHGHGRTRAPRRCRPRSWPRSRCPPPPSTRWAAQSGDVLPTKIGNGTILKARDGKPLITYIGAEYCPFCAAERWSLAVALSRFGTFSNLSGTHSSDSDEFPDTQTLSFYGSSYSSPYIDFQPVEEATNQPAGDGYQTLQTPTAAQSALVAKYDTQGSIPFLDIANRYVITGSSFSPQVLQGLSRSQIAADLSEPEQRGGAGDRRDGERHHGRHRLGHREPALQRRQLGDDCGDRPEAGGVTMARTASPGGCRAGCRSPRSACPWPQWRSRRTSR